MRIGAILAASKLVSPADIQAALQRQASHGGRIGDNLVELGAIGREPLEAFMARVPTEPRTVEETGLGEKELLNLLMKHVHIGALETASAVVNAIRLNYDVVAYLLELAVRQRLLVLAGTEGINGVGEMRYTLTEAGRRWAIDALAQNQYVGPAPVTIDAFCAQVEAQRIVGELVTWPRIKEAFADLVIPDRFVKQIGPALNSGRCILLYGPPGNGKTSIALRLHQIFDEVIFLPYAISVDGQIMRVFDESLHETVEVPEEMLSERRKHVLLREEYDERWVACRRPFILTGGELTLDMLDLRFDAATKFYEAPLHVKALGGCFVIDDFGRQTVAPASLLNRWIIPLENRVDFLKLHTGKSVRVPFDELVVFSTNYTPESLLDAALLRRVPYKLEVAGPTLQEFRDIFDRLSEVNGMTLSDEMFAFIVQQLTEVKKVKLAAYHANFIVEQMLANSRFMGTPPTYDRDAIEDAVHNLRVARGDGGDEALSGVELH
jgi:hypothetical protein